MSHLDKAWEQEAVQSLLLLLALRSPLIVEGGPGLMGRLGPGGVGVKLLQEQQQLGRERVFEGKGDGERSSHCCS